MKETLMKAATDDPRSRRRRMAALRRQVGDYTIDRWAQNFLDTLDEVAGARA